MNSDIVFIRDLTVLCSVGIHAHEKLGHQRVIINVTLDVESNKSRLLSNINDVVCYETLANKINGLSTKKHYLLLEEMAENIATLCLEDPRVQKARIRLEKPDIMKDAASVGVEIERTRE